MLIRLIKLSRHLALVVTLLVPFGVWQQSDLALWLSDSIGGIPAITVKALVWPAFMALVLLLLRSSSSLVRATWIVSLGLFLLIVSDAGGAAGFWTRFLSSEVASKLGGPPDILLLAGLIGELAAGAAYLALALSADWDDVLRERDADVEDRTAVIVGSTRISMAALLASGITALLAGLLAGLASGTINMGSVASGALLIAGTGLIGISLAILVQTSVSRGSKSTS